jgi:hypothetical protein
MQSALPAERMHISRSAAPTVVTISAGNITFLSTMTAKISMRGGTSLHHPEKSKEISGPWSQESLNVQGHFRKAHDTFNREGQVR